MSIRSALQQAVAQIRCDKELGTGFFVLPEGWLLTCHHVIRDTPDQKIQVTWKENRLVVLETKRFQEEDVAYIRVKRPNLVHGKFPFVRLSRFQWDEDVETNFWSLGYSYERYGFSGYPMTGQVAGVARFKERSLIVLKNVDVAAGASGAPFVVEKGRSVQGIINANLETLKKLGQIHLVLDEFESETQIDLYLQETKYIGFAIPVDIVFKCLPHLEKQNLAAVNKDAFARNSKMMVYGNTTEIKRALDLKERDLLVIEERISSYVLSTDIPLEVLKERKILKKEIDLLRGTLQQLVDK